MMKKKMMNGTELIEYRECKVLLDILYWRRW